MMKIGDFEKRIEPKPSANKGTCRPIEAPPQPQPVQEPPRFPLPRPMPTCKIPQTLVEFDVSSQCTRACSFCAPGIPRYRRKTPIFLDPKVHQKILADLKALGYNRPDRWLCYCGHGEPLMHPNLVQLLRDARRDLPECKIVLYTNGDLLTEKLCCTFEALDLDVLHWDLYEAADAQRVVDAIAASSLDPERVRVLDHTSRQLRYSSRSGTVRRPEEGWIDKPCGMPSGKLFFAAEGYWLLCCEDYRHKRRFPGGLTPDALNQCEEFVTITEALKEGNRNICTVCSRCDRDGGHTSGFKHVPLLTSTPLWKPTPKAIPTPEGRRLVVVLSGVDRNNASKAQASDKLTELVLGGIKRASTMQGDTLLIWGDDTRPCPPSLKALATIVWEYPYALGWCGISRGIGRAFKFATEQGYDWVIKLDTDTAILRKGWDAYLCDACPKTHQAGTWLDQVIVGQASIPDTKWENGLFNRQLATHCRWARGWVGRGNRKWDHIQGGCYVFGIEALRRIEDIVGLEAQDQNGLPESERVGEDIYFDTKRSVAMVPFMDTRLARSTYAGTILLKHAQHHRDKVGAVVVHPVKDPETMRQILGEIEP